MSAPACSTVCGSVPVGGGGGIRSAVKLTDALVTQAIPGNALTIVDLPIKEFAVGSALTADEANSRIIVNVAGVYRIEHLIIWTGTADLSVEGGSGIVVNNIPAEIFAASPDLTEEQAYSYSNLLELAAGDVIQLVARHNGTNPIEVAARLWATPA